MKRYGLLVCLYLFSIGAAADNLPISGGTFFQGGGVGIHIFTVGGIGFISSGRAIDSFSAPGLDVGYALANHQPLGLSGGGSFGSFFGVNDIFELSIGGNTFNNGTGSFFFATTTKFSIQEMSTWAGTLHLVLPGTGCFQGTWFGQGPLYQVDGCGTGMITADYFQVGSLPYFSPQGLSFVLDPIEAIPEPETIAYSILGLTLAPLRRFFAREGKCR